MSHTKEPWCVDFGATGHPYYYIVAGKIPMDEAAVIATVRAETKVGPSGDEARANARRIVACVNACAGEDTHFLEYIVSEGKTLRGIREDELASTSRFVRELNATEEQRDELLAALKGMVEVFGDEFGQGDSDTVDRAMTAIAKVEGSGK